MFKINQGVVQSALKVVVYGPEGIGKSTFASRFPDPLFIDTEGSTNHMNVKRLEKPSSWTMLMQEVQYIKSTPGICKTLVIDTVDWAEQLCVEHICAKHNKTGIEDFGYGNGYVYVKEELGRFLNMLNDLIEHNINIVLTAHAQIRKFEQPDELGAYDRYELKLGKKTSSQTSPLVKEWADMVLFANYKTISVAVDDKGKKHKAQGGKRIMYTAHHPCWDAKNRHSLPEEMEFSFAGIAHLFKQEEKQPIAENLAKEDTYFYHSESESCFMVAKGEVLPNDGLSQEISKEKYEQLKNKSDAKPLDINANAEPQIHTTEQPVAVQEYDQYEGLPQALVDLMKANNVSEELLRKAVFEKKRIYPLDMPIKEFDPGFIQGVLIGAWDKILEYINTNLMPF